MPFDDLHAFLKFATGAGEVVRIQASVDPVHELAAIAHEVSRAHGGWSPVLVFDNVLGSKFPVVANLLSSTDRLLKVLDVDAFDAAVARVAGAFAPRLGAAEDWLESLKLPTTPSETGRLQPKVLRSGLSQQVVKLGKDVSLRELPILHAWPGESGRTITAGVVHLSNLPGTSRQLALMPVEVLDGDVLQLHWNAHSGSERLFADYQRAGRQMPVAIVLGGDPLLPFIASLVMPQLIDPYSFAGILRGENVNLVRGRSVELEVAAEAEIVIEGYIDPIEPAGTGVVANAFGYLAANEHLPLMRVTGITHRANPLFPVLVRGPAPCEEHAFGQVTERLLLPMARMLEPDIVDLHLPLAGYSRRIAFVALRKTSPMQGRRVMNLLWGLPVFCDAKMIVVVDSEVDLRAPDRVWQQVASQAHPQRDCVPQEGVTDMDDHAAPLRGLGSKVGIDATTKTAAEGHSRRWWQAAQTSESTAEILRTRWPEYGLGEWGGP